MFLGLPFCSCSRGPPSERNRVSKMPQVQSPRAQNQVDQRVQPCLRWKVQNWISSALQRRDQVPYHLPDHLWQQWIPAGELRLFCTFFGHAEFSRWCHSRDSKWTFFLKKIFFYYSIVDLNPVNIATLRPSAIVPPTLNVFQYKRRNAKKFQWKPQSSSKKSNVYPFNWTWPNWATHKGIHARDITYHNK